MKDKWFAIVNPHAGIEKCRKNWDKIEYFLSKNNLNFDFVFTAQRGHAINLTREGVKNGYRKILAVGGDGTANEVVNGILESNIVDIKDIIFAFISVGTGNDWAKSLKLPGDLDNMAKLLNLENVIEHDLGKVKYFNNNKKKERYFINVSGIGFDADVTKETNIKKDNYHGGKLSYISSLLSILFKYRFKKVMINIDNKKIFEDYLLSMNVGIGKYSGGSMIFTPEAVINDGLFDVTFISQMSKFEILKSIKKLYDGSLLEHPNVFSYKAKKIKVDSKEKIWMEADGESLGHTPLEFNILKDKIKVVKGQDHSVGAG